jgi:hypothetical protein
VVAHLVIFGTDRYVSDCHSAQRIADTLIFMSLRKNFESC